VVPPLGVWYNWGGGGGGGVGGEEEQRFAAAQLDIHNLE